MKKKLFCLLMLLVFPMCLLFTGCSKTIILNEVDNSNTNTSFIVVDNFLPSSGAYGHYVLVHKQTRVMYLSSINGSIEVMVDAEGKPLIYDEGLVI